MLRKLEALRLEAADRLAEIGENANSRVSDRLLELDDVPHYERLRARAAEVGERARPKVAAAKEAVVHARAKTRDTDAARAVGRATRGVKSGVQALPVLSGVGDAIATRHGLDLLVPMVKELPQDAQRNLWLGEALQRAERDMRNYTAARTAARTLVNPMALVIRSTIKAAGELDREAGPPTSDRLLRRAFELAAAVIAQRPHDPVSLHVLARVYLAREMPADALRLAKLSIAASLPDSAEPLVTAARAYKALGEPQEAADAATLAVERGCTVGYEVLASVARSAGGTEKRVGTRARVAVTSDLLARIELADRARYYGVARTPAEILQVTTRQQRAKASATSQKTKQLAKDATEGLQGVAQQQRAKLMATSESALARARSAMQATQEEA